MALGVRDESSSQSSNPNSTAPWNFHVFLSFSGEDTRRGFTDHLYSALKRKGIITFRDDEKRERGEVISQELLKTIEESLSAIVVLSKNFASSSRCLDELQKILDSKIELGLIVLPIFYGVDPSDVRHQKGSFANAFTMYEEKFKEYPEKVRKWRDSLTKVASLSGWDSKDLHETELIQNVIEELWTKLRVKFPSCNDALFGIDKRIHIIDTLLGIELNDVCFVGIYGMGGIGKTTLARIVYERFLDQFEICCFIANMREVSSEKNGQVHLQRKLLSHLKARGMEIEDIYEGRKIIKSLYCNKKILLVIDDVSSINQLENLAGSRDWFGAGSRVIITTRDMHLLIAHGVDKVYEVERMNKDESLQLFCNKAFKRDQPKDGYLELSESMVQYARGLPLALQVLGSFLCERSVLEWEDVLDKLKTSRGATNFMSLEVHDSLEHMGMSIVLQESPNNASGRSRLWSLEDIDEVLKRNIPMWWKFGGLLSSVVGLLCYTLSSSFKHLVREWNLLNIFGYAMLSFIICSIMLLRRKGSSR